MSIQRNRRVSKDKQDVAETKVRPIREAKAHFEKVRNNFVKKGASKVRSSGQNSTKEISPLKDDIEAAPKMTLVADCLNPTHKNTHNHS